jgi:hypothetical protein
MVGIGQSGTARISIQVRKRESGHHTLVPAKVISRVDDTLFIPSETAKMTYNWGAIPEGWMVAVPEMQGWRPQESWTNGVSHALRMRTVQAEQQSNRPAMAISQASDSENGQVSRFLTGDGRTIDSNERQSQNGVLKTPAEMHERTCSTPSRSYPETSARIETCHRKTSQTVQLDRKIGFCTEILTSTLNADPNGEGTHAKARTRTLPNWWSRTLPNWWSRGRCHASAHQNLSDALQIRVGSVIQVCSEILILKSLVIIQLAQFSVLKIQKVRTGEFREAP